MNVNNKRGPGENDDGNQTGTPSFPLFARNDEKIPSSEIKVRISDCDSFPGTLEELRDPQKHTVLIKFGTFLKRTKESGRHIDTDEQTALAQIRTKLEILLLNCQQVGRQDWADYVNKRIARITELLESQGK